MWKRWPVPKTSVPRWMLYTSELSVKTFEVSLKTFHSLFEEMLDSDTFFTSTLRVLGSVASGTMSISDAAFLELEAKLRLALVCRCVLEWTT
jgi:hypothetical protein